jgi:hypothetical protein
MASYEQEIEALRIKLYVLRDRLVSYNNVMQAEIRLANDRHFETKALRDTTVYDVSCIVEHWHARMATVIVQIADAQADLATHGVVSVAPSVPVSV